MSQTENKPAQNGSQNAVNAPVVTDTAASRAVAVLNKLPDVVTPDNLSKALGSKPTGTQIRKYLRESTGRGGEGDRMRWVFSKREHKDFLVALITRLQSGSGTAAPVDASVIAAGMKALLGNSGR